MTPGVSILAFELALFPFFVLLLLSVPTRQVGTKHLRLTLEILHYIEELVIHVWLLVELDFDLVKIAQRILRRRVSAERRRAQTGLGQAYVENRLLPLGHPGRPLRDGMPGAHTRAERQLLHGSGTILGCPSAILGLERTAEDSAGAGRPKGVVGAVGAIRAVRPGRDKDLVLSTSVGWRTALLGRPIGIAVERAAEAGSWRRRAADGQRWSRAPVVC